MGLSSDLAYDGPLFWAIAYEAPLSMLSACSPFSSPPLACLGTTTKSGVEPAVLLGTAPGVVKRAIVFDDFSENFVDIDMNARRQAVDEWMASRRETQSMYWEQPTDAYRSYSTYRSQLRSQQQTIHDA